MNKIFILNGVGTSGKGTFVEFVNKYAPTYKYSIADLSKKAAEILGWDGSKSERDRKFLSDIIDLATEYNDAPFRDVLFTVKKFETNLIKDNVLIFNVIGFHSFTSNIL